MKKRNINFIVFLLLTLTACTTAAQSSTPKNNKATNTQILYNALEAYLKYPETFTEYSKNHLEVNKDKFAKCVEAIKPKLLKWQPTTAQCESLDSGLKLACVDGTMGATIADNLDDLIGFSNSDEPIFWDISIGAKEQFKGDWEAMMSEFLKIVKPLLICE